MSTEILERTKLALQASLELINLPDENSLAKIMRLTEAVERYNYLYGDTKERNTYLEKQVLSYKDLTGYYETKYNELKNALKLLGNPNNILACSDQCCDSVTVVMGEEKISMYDFIEKVISTEIIVQQ